MKIEEKHNDVPSLLTIWNSWTSTDWKDNLLPWYI